MPVFGTPSSPAPSGVGVDLSVVSPVVTQLYGIPLPTKRRAVLISQGQVATVQFQFFDYNGNPVDLTFYGGSLGAQATTIAVLMREVISAQTSDITSVAATIVSESNGIISFLVPSTVYNSAGVYGVEAGVYQYATTNLAFTNKFYLWVDRGLFGVLLGACPSGGPPTLDEVRVYIRDNSPGENRLLNDFEFDLAEICQATEMAIRYWNEAPPPINLSYQTTTFPIRERLLMGIGGHVMIMAAHRFRRNQLAANAGGITVDDQNKFQQYEAAGLRMTQEWKEWVKMKKVQLNMDSAVTSRGSPYGALSLFPTSPLTPSIGG